MSDSVRPHRRQPARLPSPWDFPGKNTGVGCHFLLQCVKVKIESDVSQTRPTLSDPMDRSLPGSSIHEIFLARVLEWGAIAFSALSSKCFQNSIFVFEFDTLIIIYLKVIFELILLLVLNFLWLNVHILPKI